MAECRRCALAQVQDELVAWIKTLFSAAVYAILIVTFGFQVARVEGQSMAPTLEDQDRLIVNKLVYRIGEPRRGDIVMLYYPLNPDKSFVKRVIAEEGDTVRIVDGRVYVNDVPLHDDYVPAEYRSHDDWGPQVDSRGLLLRHGRPPEQQLRQPALGHGAEEIHHRQSAAALVAGADGAGLLDRPAACPTPVRRSLARPHARPCSSTSIVAIAKIAFGYSSGAISILSDGFHSLTDAASNIVGLVGVRAAERPPDEDHPYGHRKYETVAAAAVTGLPAPARRSRCSATPSII